MFCNTADALIIALAKWWETIDAVAHFVYDLISVRKNSMQMTKRLWLILLLIGIVASFAGLADAQDGSTLMVGQPAIGQITTSGGSIFYSLSITQPSRISLQALSDTTQPVITILREGFVTAAEANSGAQSIVVLSAVLDAGNYVVQIGTLGGATGTVITLMQELIPLPVTTLIPGSPVTAEVSPQTPVALYAFNALAEVADLVIESLNPAIGAQVTLFNLTTGRTSASLDSDIVVARLRIPANGSVYRLQVSVDASGAAVPFVVCMATVSSGNCLQTATLQPTVPDASGVCSVTPNLAGGANIRQSASTDAPVLIALPGGAAARVVGIAPSGSWYNVEYNGVTGWASLSAVTASGDCASLPLTNPPPVPATPVSPTSIPAQQPATPSTATPSGPCLVTFSAEELIYTQPNTDPSFIFDEIVAGGELIPTGRWNGNGQDWWKTNYAGAWWLNAPGTAGVLSGDCSAIPFITP